MTATIDVDVLVVGGGSGALRAAVEAQEAGARVALAVKGLLGGIGVRGAGATASGTAADLRGFWPVNEAGEVVETAYDDVIQLGLGMADPELVRIGVEGVPASRRVLERHGVAVRLRVDGWGGPHTPARDSSRPTIVVGIAPSLATALRRTDCRIYERMMITNLLTQDGVCVGAVGVDEHSGEMVVFQARSVVLGTGGAAHMFKHNIHPDCLTGDGYAMGYRAGAELMNLEFMQIFPGIPYPTINNLGVWVWRQEFRLRNNQGEEFIQNYLPQGGTVEEAKAQAANHLPFSTRDSLSRYFIISMMEEIFAGRATTHDGIYMDLTAPSVRPPMDRQSWFRYRGIHWDQAPIEVVPYAMCSNGGLRVDKDAQTTVPGLYAVGECSSGMYGADRHGGYMIGSSQVFGAVAGRHAARTATRTKAAPLPKEKVAEEEARIAGIKSARGPLKTQEVRKELKQQAWNNLLAIRTEAGITSFLKTVEALSEEKVPSIRAETTRELVETLELQNMLVMGQMLGKACLLRQESRGGHYRKDYPFQDDERWLKSIVIKETDGEMSTSTLSLQPDWKSRPEDMFGEEWG